MSRTNETRAWLCGLWLRRARAIADATSLGRMTRSWPVDPHVHGLRRDPLAVAHGPRDDAAPQRAALELGDRLVLGGGRRRCPGTSSATVVVTTPVSPSDGQHLVDVAQERAARADEQDARALEQAAVRVQQVRGAVQGDGRLAGARTALHDERAAQLGADDRVLLALDRRDDVAHPAGAARGQPGQQRTLAGQPAQPCVGVPGQQVEVEHLVLDARDGAPARDHVPATHDAVGVRGGGPVERLRGRRAPVGEQLGLLGRR